MNDLVVTDQEVDVAIDDDGNVVVFDTDADGNRIQVPAVASIEGEVTEVTVVETEDDEEVSTDGSAADVEAPTAEA